MEKEFESLIKDTFNNISLLANASSFIMQNYKDINWVGFYILNNDILELGPFQGRPACIQIKVGKGVCGKSAETKSTIIVDNVHTFSGHIACDSSSNSEIVVPIFFNNKLYGVLDIDSEQYSRFKESDKLLFERLTELISLYLI